MKTSLRLLIPLFCGSILNAGCVAIIGGEIYTHTHREIKTFRNTDPVHGTRESAAVFATSTDSSPPFRFYAPDSSTTDIFEELWLIPGDYKILFVGGHAYCPLEPYGRYRIKILRVDRDPAGNAVQVGECVHGLR